MGQPIKPIRKFTSYVEPVLKCKCGSEFFEKITVNKFKTTQTDLANGQRPMKNDHAISLLRCALCDDLAMPNVSYQTSPIEKELANDMVTLLEQRMERINEAALPKEKTETTGSDEPTGDSK